MEYTKMTAVLCRHFGLKNIQLAEDIASDTFLKASEDWAINGIPDNPSAWLYSVAKNKTKDYLKHTSVFESKIKDQLIAQTHEVIITTEYNDQMISDSQLAMIFAVCNPVNSKEGQIALALQILCGFSIEEIANAFLAKSETIKKRLQRSRKNLRNDNFQINELGPGEISSRMESVLKTLYLLFNEGYFSKTGNLQIRKDLCSEAIRLTLILTDNPFTCTPQTYALLALMCFQSSRLSARTNNNGETILFNDQDRSLWDSSLIQRGNYYLIKATNENKISKYHLEAGIAYWHSALNAENKWLQILKLYDQLLQIDQSLPIILNRLFAFAKVYGNEKAIFETEKLGRVENNHYHELLGYLYAETNPIQSIYHYKKAIHLTVSATEKQTLNREIDRLNKKTAGFTKI